MAEQELVLYTLKPINDAAPGYGCGIRDRLGFLRRFNAQPKPYQDLPVRAGRQIGDFKTMTPQQLLDTRLLVRNPIEAAQGWTTSQASYDTLVFSALERLAMAAALEEKFDARPQIKTLTCEEPDRVDPTRYVRIPVSNEDIKHYLEWYAETKERGAPPSWGGCVQIGRGIYIG